jgi:hypothetical protein
MEHDPKLWMTRPLVSDLIEFAAHAVLYLPLLYRIMRHSLDTEKRTLSITRTNKYINCYSQVYDISTMNEIHHGMRLHGYIENITSKLIYITLGPAVIGVIPVENIKTEKLPHEVEKTVTDLIYVEVVGVTDEQLVELKWIIEEGPPHLMT